MARDPATQAHQEWLGYVQPVGLVVSIPALVAAQAYVNRNIIPDHQRFLACLSRDRSDELLPEIRDVAEFVHTVLGWRESDLEAVVPGDPHYAGLEVTLPEYHETLRPTHIVREPEPEDASRPRMMLIHILPTGSPFDVVSTTDDRHWQATPQAKFERLLRETQVPLGLLINHTHLRMVYAPRGETHRVYDLQRVGHDAGCWALDICRLAHAALRGAALQPGREATPPRYSGR